MLTLFLSELQNCYFPVTPMLNTHKDFSQAVTLKLNVLIRLLGPVLLDCCNCSMYPGEIAYKSAYFPMSSSAIKHGLYSFLSSLCCYFTRSLFIDFNNTTRTLSRFSLVFTLNITEALHFTLASLRSQCCWMACKYMGTRAVKHYGPCFFSHRCFVQLD